jgi:hypothetical protein
MLLSVFAGNGRIAAAAATVATVAPAPGNAPGVVLRYRIQ